MTLYLLHVQDICILLWGGNPRPRSLVKIKPTMLYDFANHYLVQQNEIKARTSRSDLLDFMVVNGIFGQP